MINSNCPSCGSADFNVLYDLTKTTSHPGKSLRGLIKKCSRCSLLFKTYDTDLNELYNQDKLGGFLYTEGKHITARRYFFSEVLQESYQRFLALNPGKIPLLLDIGSGTGNLLQVAKEVGFEAVGVELSAKIAAIATEKGFTVINADVADISLDRKFDTITMMDLIEHLENPEKVLRDIRKLTAPKAELIVYTPNHNSLIVKVSQLLYSLGFKYPVENIFAGAHTVFFTTKTLQQTIENAGFKVTEITHSSYDISRPGQKVSLLMRVAVNLIDGVGSLFGLKGFRVMMVAKPA